MTPIPYHNLLKELALFKRAVSDRDALNTLTEHFKVEQPKFPSVLSESLCYHLLKRGLISTRFDLPNLKLHGGTGDLTTSDNRNIGAKGTGIENGFISVTDSDLQCDCIIWLNFYWYLIKNSDVVSATIFYSPSEYLVKQHITYSAIGELYSVGNDMEHITVINLQTETVEVPFDLTAFA